MPVVRLTKPRTLPVGARWLRVHRSLSCVNLYHSFLQYVGYVASKGGRCKTRLALHPLPRCTTPDRDHQSARFRVRLQVAIEEHHSRGTMVATQIMQAMGPREDSMKPLPSLPSPTLTNPDMVLPNEPIVFPALPSPPRNVWRERPPSPSYLRDKAQAVSHERSGSGGSIAMAAKKEKRGLMSRKMMLLRSRTASNGIQNIQNTSHPQPNPFQSFSNERSSQDYGSAYGSSPTLLDVANPALEQAEYRRASASGSSTLSEDMSSLPQFLAKYETANASGTDDELDSSPAPPKYGYAVTIEGGLDEKRRQQEEDEHTSAILSQRAEQILANAKKRLNVSVEGWVNKKLWY